MVIHQNGFIRTSFSATVTWVSKFVEENVLPFYIVKIPRSWSIQSLIAQHVKYANRNALSMFKKCFK